MGWFHVKSMWLCAMDLPRNSMYIVEYQRTANSMEIHVIPGIRINDLKIIYRHNRWLHLNSNTWWSTFMDCAALRNHGINWLLWCNQIPRDDNGTYTHLQYCFNLSKSQQLGKKFIYTSVGTACSRTSIVYLVQWKYLCKLVHVSRSPNKNPLIWPRAIYCIFRSIHRDTVAIDKS